MSRVRSGVGVLLGLCLALVLVTSVRADVLTGFRPAEPQPTALSPGLSVAYWYGMVNHINELRTKKFEPGPALTNLDYHWGPGNVLTSKAREGVGAIITGFIRFDAAGLYGFAVTSNDGVRVEIGGRLLHEDPGVHGDTTSDRIDVQINQPGWYPVRIVYFQKKGTAALILEWIAPGQKGPLVPVPAKAFAYSKQ
jgi:hypothetical protein